LLATTCARVSPTNDVIGKSPMRIRALEIKLILAAMIYLLKERGPKPPVSFTQ